MHLKILNPNKIQLRGIKNILIFFFVFSLIFSRFLADLIVVISAISFIYFKIKKDIKIKPIFLYVFLFFYIYLIINSFFSEIPSESFKTSLPYIRFALCIFFFLIYFSDKNSLKTLLFTFILFYLLLFFDSIFQNFFKFNIFGYPIDESWRTSSFFKKELILGSFVSKTFAIVIFLIFYLEIKKKILLYFLTILITFILVYLSRERASMLFYFLVLFFSFFLIEKKLFFKIVLLVIFNFFLVVSIFPGPLERLYYHTKSQISESMNNFSIFSKRHELHFITAFRMFNNFPILGGGVKSFRYLCENEPFSVTDVIKNDPSNIVLSPFDGYIYFIKDVKKLNNTKISFLIFFKKEFFENNKIKSLYKDKVLQLALDNSLNNTSSLIVYSIFENHFFSKEHNNFKFIEKGKKLFTHYEFKNGCNTHPHHLFLQMLAETGIIGFLILLFFYIFILKNLFKKILDYIKQKKVHGNPDIVIYANYFAFFFPLMSSGNFFNNYYSILLYFPFTFILLCQRK